MNLRVVLSLHPLLSDLMRPPLDHIKHVEVGKCCGRISNIVGVITLKRKIFNGVSEGNSGVLGLAFALWFWSQTSITISNQSDAKLVSILAWLVAFHALNPFTPMSDRSRISP